MKVSVIIAIYNEEKYIEECLKSLIKQSFKDFEIIVVDDGSKDNSGLKVKQLKKELKIKNLKLIFQKHQGAAAARNRGAKIAKGEILVFLDADMVFDKNFLKVLTKPILTKIAKGTFSTEEKVANWENVWARCWNYNWGLKDKRRINLKRGDQIKDFRAILREEFEKVGGFEKSGYTDTWTLSEKLNYLPVGVKAYYYHYNPSTLKEVFFQAKWVAKRKYKWGNLGKFLTLFRASFPLSILTGILKSLFYKEPKFLIFKIFYDFGFSWGILESIFGKNYP